MASPLSLYCFLPWFEEWGRSRRKTFDFLVKPTENSYSFPLQTLENEHIMTLSTDKTALSPHDFQKGPWRLFPDD